MAPSPPLDLYILTFNCARALVNPGLLGPHVFRALPKDARLPDVVMFSLQEIAPISYSFLGGSYLTPYFEQLVASLNIAAKFRDEGSPTYKQILTRNVGMTAIMLFAREDTAEHIRWIQTAGTGVGVWEMGNKGAVGIRLGYALGQEGGEEVEMTLVAAHLAPMENACARRNEDWKNIVRRLIFANEDGGESQRGRGQSQAKTSEERQPLLDTPRPRGREVSPCPLYSTRGHVFLAGDLNYRTSSVSPSEDSYLSFPQPKAASNDANHISKLFEKDQLTQVLREGEALQGFNEMPVTFPPTYKYDHSPEFSESSSLNPPGWSSSSEPDHWNWARHRFPSWCDRILFLPSSLIQPQKYTALPLQLTSDHRPVALSTSIKLEIPKISDSDVRKHPPYNPDPEWRAKRDAARRLEIIVGILAYLAYTREGNTIVIGGISGIVGSAFLFWTLLH